MAAGGTFGDASLPDWGPSVRAVTQRQQGQLDVQMDPQFMHALLETRKRRRGVWI